MKRLEYGALFVAFLLGMAGLVSFGLENSALREARRFDAAVFKEIPFTMEELTLFCDVAFVYENSRIRKWTTDIKVEIKNIESLDPTAIDEVDSVIAIFAPLIAPLTIERVEKGGNLHVFRRVSFVMDTVQKRTRHHLNGLARINKKTSHSWDINHACVYDGPQADTQTLVHEFQHALGLDHPINLYSFYVNIGRSVIPQYFESQKQYRAYLNQPFYLSEQDKKVIRMLYSPEIKPGLHIDYFARHMGLSKHDVQRMLPNRNKPRSVVVYPVPQK